MTIETDPSRTEYNVLRPQTTAERENGCNPGPGVLQGGAAPSDRRLRAVPSSDGSARIHEEPMSPQPGDAGPGSARRSGRNRTARRAEGRRMRAALPVEGGGLLHREAGMATAEYAIATLAAVGFAALLVAVLSSGQIKGLLMSLITTALNFG
jgi:hypothetical protein